MRKVTVTYQGEPTTNMVRGDSDVKAAFNAGVEWALGNLNVRIGDALDETLDIIQLAGYASTISVEG